jgi:hypothetical protein
MLLNWVQLRWLLWSELGNAATLGLLPGIPWNWLGGHGRPSPGFWPASDVEGHDDGCHAAIPWGLSHRLGCSLSGGASNNRLQGGCSCLKNALLGGIMPVVLVDALWADRKRVGSHPSLSDVSKQPSSGAPPLSSCLIPPCHLIVDGKGWSMSIRFPGVIAPPAGVMTQMFGLGCFAVLARPWSSRRSLSPECLPPSIWGWQKPLATRWSSPWQSGGVDSSSFCGDPLK